MILFPQEWFDELAAIATVRPWSDFFQWFIAHARELSRFFDGKQKRAFKNFTRPQLRDFLLQNGYAIAMPEPEPPPIDPELQFLDAEYDVYSEVFRQYDLFQFDRPGTLVSDYTGRDRFPKMQRLLEFESETKTYHVRETIDASISWPEGEYWDRLREKQGLLDNFSLKNRWIWKLEKRFHVESGYRFRSELTTVEAELRPGLFWLSRVGFDAEKKTALVFLGYPIGAYYLVFRHDSGRWQRVDYLMAWVV